MHHFALIEFNMYVYRNHLKNYCMKFLSINYLEQGNERQRALHSVLTSHKLMEMLADYNPIVVGTIPINCDIATSDVDILLQVNDVEEAINNLSTQFGHIADFDFLKRSPTCLLVNFTIDSFQFELYCSTLPTVEQMGYLHMIKENELLEKHGESLRKKVIQLKNQGLKTEPAFCKALNITGNPFKAILDA